MAGYRGKWKNACGMLACDVIFVTMSDKLTALQAKFVIEYCRDLREDGGKPNQTKAAERAGCLPNSAAQTASDWLKLPKIEKAIRERKDEIAAAAGVTSEHVLRQWLVIANADPAELIQMRRTCCRYCYGLGHRYQWTEAEYMAAIERAVSSGKEPPDGMGGFGFDVNADPLQTCPECGGNGVESVHIADTRKLSQSARKLYAGVHKTKDGIRILMRDQDKALDNLAKYLGMLVERREHTGPNGGPIGVANLSADDLTDDQLAAVLGMSDEAAEDANQT